MIIHHKRISNNYTIGKTKLLKYSEDYSFIPLKINNDNKYQLCIFQTPKLFIPYGLQTVDNKKQIIDLSFQNIDNDESISNFLFFLKKIYKIIQNKYPNYIVNSFMKETIHGLCIRFKIDPNALFYNSFKQRINTIGPFIYGYFIIQLKGLWIHKDQIWFQWCLLQGKVEESIILDKYVFIEEDSKYDKMLKMGIPREAIELKRKMDSNIPPPPPLPISNKNKSIPKIQASDLRNVVLKKIKPNLKKMKRQINPNHFEPPSIEELQITISKLKKNI